MAQIFKHNIIIDDFVSSQYGLSLLSFGYNGDSEDDYALGGNMETVYLGNSRIATLVHTRYQNCLTPQATFVSSNGDFISPKRLREITRALTGKNTWLWMQTYDEFYGESLYYRCLITKVTCKKAAGEIVGMIIDFQCDSMYAYTKEFVYKKAITSQSNTVTIHNTSDETNDYLYPFVTLKLSSSEEYFTVKNSSDNNYTTKLENLIENEIITLNGGKSEITSSDTGKNILDYFNFHFIKLIPGKNILTFSSPCEIELRYRFLRKVGI